MPLKHGAVWFKACGPVQEFEASLTAELYTRWPALIPEVLRWDGERSWLLLADAGTPIAQLGNPPELWLRLLPLYAEMQREESPHAGDHLDSGVPDMRVATLPGCYEELLAEQLPLERGEIGWLRAFVGEFAVLCTELMSSRVRETIQHDDLHMNNVFLDERRTRVLDWGDACVSHPFASLVATFRFLEERNGLLSDDRWFTRLRDAYLEAWGGGLTEVFDLAYRVGAFAHAMAALRQRGALSTDQRDDFDRDLSVKLRRAVAINSARR